MPKEKVTLTLDAAQVAELRMLAGARSLSAAVDAAVMAHIAKLRQNAAIDQWLAEADKEWGPVSPATKRWAAEVLDGWEALRDSETERPSRAG